MIPCVFPADTKVVDRADGPLSVPNQMTTCLDRQSLSTVS